MKGLVACNYKHQAGCICGRTAVKNVRKLANLEKRYKKLQQKMKDLNEVIGPFVLHGKAHDALHRDDIATVIAKVGHSYLTLGMFKMLMEEVDKKEFRL